MTEPAKAKLTYGEYLALEQSTQIKHEYLDGAVRAMAGGTLEHGRLASEMSYLVRGALTGRPCVVFSSDAKVRIEATNRSTYPDLTIVCGELERSARDAEAIANPTVIVEVISESTEGYDRGEKFRHYRRIDSLREYVLVSQAQPLVEVWRREGEAWLPSEFGPGQEARLESIDASISIDALYAAALAAS
jgi:Uma2 family endonuclease